MRPSDLTPLPPPGRQEPELTEAGVTPRGLTTAEFGRQFRVGQDKIRRWIANGQLAAVNVANGVSGRPRWIITVEAVAAFVRRRSSGPAPKPQRRKRAVARDYYPD